MRSLSLIVIALIIFAAVFLPQLLFSVDETEVAIVTRFGQIKSEIYDAGLNVKTPFMDTVTKFDKRLLIFDSPPNSLLTKDKKRLIIDVYARGRIVDSGTFRERLGDEQRASDRAVDIISSELRREIASHNQSEIITTQRDLMMANVLKAVKPKLADFGIQIDDVRIKRADFPNEIAESVYARMQAERKRKADKEREAHSHWWQKGHGQIGGGNFRRDARQEAQESRLAKCCVVCRKTGTGRGCSGKCRRIRAICHGVCSL